YHQHGQLDAGLIIEIECVDQPQCYQCRGDVVAYHRQEHRKHCHHYHEAAFAHLLRTDSLHQRLNQTFGVEVGNKCHGRHQKQPECRTLQQVVIQPSQHECLLLLSSRKHSLHPPGRTAEKQGGLGFVHMDDLFKDHTQE